MANSRFMKICYLNNDFNEKTGSGRFCSSLIEALNKSAPDLQSKVVTLDGVALNLWRLVPFLRRLRKTVKDFDVIHALDGWPHGFLAVLASVGLKNKVVITLIGTGAVKPLYQPIKKKLLKWAYRRADKLVAVSRNTRAEVLRGVPGLEIEVINHGVDYEKFQVSSYKFQDVGNLKPYILSVGALKKRKGYRYSIEAFAEIAARFPDLKYVIVGQGPERQNLKSQISNLKLQDRVVFLDGVEENFLVELYCNAELFILLSQDVDRDIEGFGLVFLEAAACGLPVVAMLGTGAADAVRDGYNGLLVPAADSYKAAQAMTKILSAPELKNLFSKNSLELARVMSWGKAADAYLGVYQKVMR